MKLGQGTHTVTLADTHVQVNNVTSIVADGGTYVVPTQTILPFVAGTGIKFEESEDHDKVIIKQKRENPRLQSWVEVLIRNCTLGPRGRAYWYWCHWASWVGKSRVARAKENPNNSLLGVGQITKEEQKCY